MKSLIPFVMATVLSLPAFAQRVEAMKPGDPHGEAVAQAMVDARAKIPLNLITHPEAERSFDAQAAAAAESRKAQRLQGPRHPADQSQALLQYQRL